MAESDDIFAALDRALAGPSKGSLSRYMRQNLPELAKRLDGHQNDWTAIAKVFADAGFKDKQGNPPSGITARKIYERIKREHKAKAGPDTTPLTPTRRTFAISTPKREI